MQTIKKSKFATITLLLALLGAVTAAMFVFGAQLGLWEPITGMQYSRQGNDPIGYAICALSIVCLIYVLGRKDRSGVAKPIMGLVLGLMVLSPTIINKINPPQRFPPIHDISTDTVNPPVFTFLDDNRPGARNTLVYGGAEVAAHQESAFPDIAPIITGLAPAEAFDQAIATAQTLGWDIVAQDDDALRFEASDKTPFFAFIDDIVVVVSEDDAGSRVDLRSVSRVGRGDRGQNAKRVRGFINAFGSSS